MPPRAAPGNRSKMEDALGSDLRLALGQLCTLLGIPSDRWHRVPALARPFEAAAVARLASKLKQAEGLGWREATERAAIRLGLNPDTAVSRRQRLPKSAYRPAA